jgi:hypothetical protein
MSTSTPVAVAWDSAFLACASRKFADLLSGGGPYPSLDATMEAARDIWWRQVSECT